MPYGGAKSAIGRLMTSNSLLWPVMSVRQLASALILATALPLLLLAFFMYSQMVSNSRQTARDSMIGEARLLAALVDNEIDTHLAVAASLSTSAPLRIGDLVAFRAQAIEALKTLPGAWLSVSSPDGRFVMTTYPGMEEPLPPRGQLATMARAWSTGRPQVSDVVTGPISGRRNAFIEHPVFKDGVPLYTIIVGFNPDRFHRLMRDKFSGTSAIAVIDRQRRFIARVPRHEESLGELAAPGWRAALDRSPEGVGEFPTIEHTPSLQAYVTTREGWAVGIAYPIEVLDASGRRIMQVMIWVGMSAIAASAALGFALSRRLSGAMLSLASAARKVGNGEITSASSHRILEADAIGDALSTTSRELAERTSQLRESEERFRGTFDNTAVGVAHVGLDGRFLEVNRRLCDILGYSHEELLTRTFQEITFQDDLEHDLANIRKLQAGEFPAYTMDKRFVRKNGSIVWTGLTVSMQRYQSGTSQYFIKVVRDITERKVAQAHQQFLLRELAHRMKNQLAVIQAMAGQTARSAGSVKDFQREFSSRLHGLAVSTDLLVSQDWTGTPLESLVEAQLKPFNPGSDRLLLAGPSVTIDPDATQAIGLALHELATNSLKHGAWSVAAGTVTVSWHADQDRPDQPCLLLNWLERGGPPVAPPTRKGFGHVVVETIAAQRVGGTADMLFGPEGLSWTLTVPAAHFGAEANPRAGELGPTVKKKN